MRLLEGKEKGTDVSFAEKRRFSEEEERRRCEQLLRKTESVMEKDTVVLERREGWGVLCMKSVRFARPLPFLFSFHFGRCSKQAREKREKEKRREREGRGEPRGGCCDRMTILSSSLFSLLCPSLSLPNPNQN